MLAAHVVVVSFVVAAVVALAFVFVGVAAVAVRTRINNPELPEKALIANLRFYLVEAEEAGEGGGGGH